MNINTSTFYRLKNKKSEAFLQHKEVSGTITTAEDPRLREYYDNYSDPNHPFYDWVKDIPTTQVSTSTMITIFNFTVIQGSSLPDDIEQQWLLIKVNNDDCYMIANRATGLCLSAFGENVLQFPPLPDNHFQHWIVQVENGIYRLKNKKTGEYLQGGTQGSFMENVMGPARADVKLKSSSASSSQQWEFVPADPISNEPKIPGSISNDKLPLPVLKGHKSQSITDKILVSSKVLPYSFVNDPNLSTDEQINKSPYYRLNTYVYWLGKSQLFIGNATSSAENEVTLSTTVTNGTEVSKTETDTFTIGVSVTASAGTSFGPVDVSLEVTASTEWSKETSKTETSSYEESITISQRVAAPPYKSIQLFYRVVEEQLVRGDGTIARKWAVASGDTQADEFPNKSD